MRLAQCRAYFFIVPRTRDCPSHNSITLSLYFTYINDNDLLLFYWLALSDGHRFNQRLILMIHNHARLGHEPLTEIIFGNSILPTSNE